MTSSRISPSYTNSLWIFLLVAYLVAFPKAGIKINSIPITFGYVLLSLLSISALFLNLAARQYSWISLRRLICLLALAPVQALTIMLTLTNGFSGLGETASFLVGFFVMPAQLLFITAPQVDRLNVDQLMTFLKYAMRFVAIYGIILFFFHHITGTWIEIPYLTVNADDVGQLGEKMIVRGDFAKLISTYNNGNIYGVCILMLLPLYERAERSKLFLILMRASLILTLSRTVWFGMIAYEILSFLALKRRSMKSMLQLFGGILFAAASLIYMLMEIGLDKAFLFDSELGGRSEEISATPWSLLPIGPVSWPSEIIFVNIANALGVIGLILFFPAILAPIVLTWRSRYSLSRACSVGMLMLVICGLSDGPFLLIPTMSFFWALSTIGMIQPSWMRLNERDAVSIPSSLLKNA